MKINDSLCAGCGSCIEKCMFGAIEMVNGTAVIDEGKCTGCGLCKSACPCDAIEGETNTEVSSADLKAYKGVWIVSEMNDDGTMNGVTLELLSKGKELAQQRSSDVTAVIIANTVSDNVKERISDVGCCRILLLKSKNNKGYDTKLYSQLLLLAIEEEKPEIILIPATNRGRDLAPVIAARAKTGLTADCTALSIDENGDLVQTRPTYGGNIMASIVTRRHRPQMATVRPKVLPIVHCPAKSALTVDEKDYGDLASNEDRIKLTELIDKEFPVSDVSEANIIVTGGYGVGSAENFKLIYRLAAKLNGAAGATRKAVDEGWAPMEIQVGQTGKTTAPDLYIAIGVSGALQHVIGMKESKKIIAVNNDPMAPIFSYSDIAILGDAKEILSEMLKILEERSK